MKMILEGGKGGAHISRSAREAIDKVCAVSDTALQEKLGISDRLTYFKANQTLGVSKEFFQSHPYYLEFFGADTVQVPRADRLVTQFEKGDGAWDLSACKNILQITGQSLWVGSTHIQSDQDPNGFQAFRSAALLHARTIPESETATNPVLAKANATIRETFKAPDGKSLTFGEAFQALPADGQERFNKSHPGFIDLIGDREFRVPTLSSLSKLLVSDDVAERTAFAEDIQNLSGKAPAMGVIKASPAGEPVKEKTFNSVADLYVLTAGSPWVDLKQRLIILTSKDGKDFDSNVKFRCFRGSAADELRLDGVQAKFARDLHQNVYFVLAYDKNDRCISSIWFELDSEYAIVTYQGPGPEMLTCQHTAKVMRANGPPPKW